MEVIYNSLNLDIDQTQYELVSAWLSQLPFESFHEDEDRLIAYYVKDQISDQDIKECIESLQHLGKINYQIETIENKNWNEEWESSFQPVTIENQICIRADFHPKEEGVKHDIIINPKMAFGTAHHETTYMMMREMLSLDLENKRIWDYGCGTSILAILAAQKGAADIIANDYDINSIENSKENLKLNYIEGVEVRHGEIDVVEENDFDLILANINRKVLTDTAEIVVSKLSKSGTLLMSGILESDKELILSVYEPILSLVSVQQKGEWLCFKWQNKD